MMKAMNGGLKAAIFAVTGISLTTATAVLAEPPGVYYSWRETEISVPDCIRRGSAALETEGLENILTDSTSVAGRSEDVTAVFLCLNHSNSTTVMVVVAGEDDAQAVRVREALKATF
jgi:hypothetical protein